MSGSRGNTRAAQPEGGRLLRRGLPFGALGLTVSALWVAAAVPALGAQEYPSEYADEYGVDFDQSLPAIDARVWFDRGDNPLFDTGDRVRVYYRASEDAYVAIFHIDTDGRTRLAFPTDPRQTHYVRGGRDYRMLFGRSQYWYVDDEPGLGFFFIVASATPMDFSQIPYSSYDRRWDLTRVGSEVHSDPYVAMDEFVEVLIPDWEYGEYGLDYAEYSVDSRHQYPRFMCYDCHGYRPFYAWNPYAYTCSTFSVVVWDDPYYYPRTRYRSDRVVYVGRRPGTRPRYEFKERPGGRADGNAVVQRRTGPQRTARRRSADGGRPAVVTSPQLRGTVGDNGAVRRGSGTVTQPSTRFRDQERTERRRTEVTRPERERPEAGVRTPVVRGRPATGSERSRPQLERRRPSGSSAAGRATTTTRRRPMTRSDAQGRVRIPSGDRARGQTNAGRASDSQGRVRSGRVQSSQPSGQRGTVQARPSRPSGDARARRGGSGASGQSRVRPSRSGGSATVRPAPSAGRSSRPTVRAPSRRSGSSPRATQSRPPTRSPARRPPPKRKPGG